MTAPDIPRLGLTERELTAARVPDYPPPELDQVDLDTFRAVMGSLPTGVSVVTSHTSDGAPRGLTCSAVCSVSASPPLLLVCVKAPSPTLAAIHESGVFGVNVLAAGTDQTARTFAAPVPERFAGVPWRPGPRTGVPLLGDTVAAAECVLTRSHIAGDHQLLIGRLVFGRSAPDQAPLAFWRTRFSELRLQPCPKTKGE
ncbi:flavin reductase family protein [Streptomyces sp. NPDC089919]|uniref:flavin reductase family protein n=1 Tax=Streptomyces sp. NPDC089919 TaxID=3155188 RepID=UPI003417135E